MAATKNSNASQSRDLVREADEHIVLDQGFCERFFSSTDAHDRADSPTDEESVREAGSSIARSWVEQATTSEIRAVAADMGIPREIDIQLLKGASQVLDVRRVPDEHVKSLRSAFKQVVEAAAHEGSNDSVPAEEAS